jgi:glutaredoxin
MNKYTVLQTLLAKALILSGLLGIVVYATISPAVTLYKWVDAEGNVSYQDRPPPSGQEFEQRSFSEQGARTGEANADIERIRAINENPVTLYVAENCASCDMVVAVLDSNDVPFEEIKVDTDLAMQNKLIELIGAIRVPTLTVGGNVIDGFDRTAIEDALRETGYPGAKTRTR